MFSLQADLIWRVWEEDVGEGDANHARRPILVGRRLLAAPHGVLLAVG